MEGEEHIPHWYKSFCDCTLPFGTASRSGVIIPKWYSIWQQCRGSKWVHMKVWCSFKIGTSVTLSYQFLPHRAFLIDNLAYNRFFLWQWSKWSHQMLIFPAPFLKRLSFFQWMCIFIKDKMYECVYSCSCIF